MKASRSIVRCRVEALAVLACLLLATPVDAQERGFLGLTTAVARDDGRQQGPTRSPYAWSIEGAFFISDRIALGAELLKPGDLQSLSSLRSRTTETEQRERAVLATVRARIKREEPVAFDAVAGIGGVRQETTFRSTSSFFGAPPSVTTGTDTASWLALLAGIEVRIRVVEYLHVTPTARAYYFNRPDTRSSLRPTAGVALRASW